MGKENQTVHPEFYRNTDFIQQRLSLANDVYAINILFLSFIFPKDPQPKFKSLFGDLLSELGKRDKQVGF